GPSMTAYTAADTEPPVWQADAPLQSYTQAFNFLTIRWTAAVRVKDGEVIERYVTDDAGDIAGFKVYVNNKFHGLQTPGAYFEDNCDELGITADGQALQCLNTYYHLENLSPATDYTITVQAVDAAGYESTNGPTLTTGTSPFPA